MPDSVTGVDLVAGAGVAIEKALTPGTRGNLAQYEISMAAGRNFYLAASDASDIAGYKTLLTSPSAGAEQTIATACTGTGDVLIEEFATDVGVPGAAEYPAGTAVRSLYARVSGGSARIHLLIYVRNAAGAETLVRDEFSPEFTNIAVALQQWIASPPSGGTLLATDRLVAKLYAQRVSGPTTITVTTHYEGVSPAQIQTTIPAPVTTAIPISKLTPGGLGALLYTAAGPTSAWTDPARIGIYGNSLQFGDGATSDTALGRGSNAQELYVSNYLRVYRTVTANDEGTNVVLGETGSGPGLKIGSDVRLYRSAASTLKTDAALVSIGLSSLLAAADAQPTFRINPSGRLEWGVGGATPPDVSLYRFGANDMRLTGMLRVNDGGTGLLTLGTAAGTIAAIYFSNLIDTVLYRNAAQQLRTNGKLITDDSILASFGLASQVVVGDTGAGVNGLRFGSAQDVALYRASATELRTNSDFRVGANVLIATTGIISGPANFDFRSTGDCYMTCLNAGNSMNLRDLVGNILKWQTGILNIQAASGVPKITLNADATANLYRSAAGVVKTDGSLNIVGDLILSGATAHLQAASTVAAAVGGSNIAKLPIYNASNVLIGYIPIYQT